MSVTEEVPVQPTPSSEYVASDKAVEPQAQPASQEIVVQPAIAMHAASLDENGLVIGSWKNDTCSCCNYMIPNCCMAFWCPCVSLSQTLHRVGLMTYTNALVILVIIYGATEITGILANQLTEPNCDGNDCKYNVSFWAYISLAFGLICTAAVTITRTRIRGMFQIPGNVCEDCLCGFFCGCCAIAQMATQTESYTPSLCNFAAKDTLPGYVV